VLRLTRDEWRAANPAEVLWPRALTSHELELGLVFMSLPTTVHAPGRLDKRAVAGGSRNLGLQHSSVRHPPSDIATALTRCIRRRLRTLPSRSGGWLAPTSSAALLANQARRTRRLLHAAQRLVQRPPEAVRWNDRFGVTLATPVPLPVFESLSKNLFLQLVRRVPARRKNDLVLGAQGPYIAIGQRVHTNRAELLQIMF
jgi:hypothetical protein